MRGEDLDGIRFYQHQMGDVAQEAGAIMIDNPVGLLVQEGVLAAVSYIDNVADRDVNGVLTEY